MNNLGKKVMGKATAIAALCLFSFTGMAQNRVLEVLPGMATFTYQGDTIDTNAFPTFFRALGCDSACAIQRTAIVLTHIGKYNSVEKLDRFLIEDLQGIGLRHYAWLRGWAMECGEARESYIYGANKNRK